MRHQLYQHLLLILLMLSPFIFSPQFAIADSSKSAAACPILPVKLMGALNNNATFSFMPNTNLRAGYAISNAGASSNQQVVFSGGNLTVQISCTGQEFADDANNTLQLFWSFPNLTYTPLKPGQWSPTNDQCSSYSFQSTIVAPELCGAGKRMYAGVWATFSAGLQSVAGNSAKLQLQIKAHYESVGGDNGASGTHYYASSQWSLTESLPVVCPTVNANGTVACSDNANSWPSLNYTFMCCDPAYSPTTVSVAVGDPPRSVRMFKWSQSIWDSCYSPTFTQCIYNCGRTIPYCMSVADAACYASPCKNWDPTGWGPKACDKNRRRTMIHIYNDAKSLTNYQTAQNAACTCVLTSSLPKANSTNTTSPSPLESWPFFAIDHPSTDPQALFDSMELVDFVPSSLSYLSFSAPDSEWLAGIPPTVTLKSQSNSRPDIVELSSAMEVLGADYYLQSIVGSNKNATTEEMARLRGGMILAKGRRVVEHSVPTCARFSGGRVLSVMQHRFRGQDLYIGIVDQATGGCIQTTSLVVQVFADKLRVTSTWSASQMQMDPAAIGAVTLQLWAPIHIPQADPAVFRTMIEAVIDSFDRSVVPVEWDIMQSQRITQNALTRAANARFTRLKAGEAMSDADKALLKEDDSDTLPSLFWFHNVSFHFPSTVELTLRSASSVLPDLQLNILAWRDSHPQHNSTKLHTISSTSFNPAGWEIVQGRMAYSTKVLLQLHNVQEAVIVASYSQKDLNATQPTSGYFVDQVFTNLGYSFYIGAAGGQFIAGHWLDVNSADLDPVPSVNGAYTSGSILLPGSGRVYVPTGVSGKDVLGNPAVFGVARSLTPTDAAVDLSKYWGVGVFVRLNSLPRLGTTSNQTSYDQPRVFMQIRVESPLITDFNYPISPSVQVQYDSIGSDPSSGPGCWTHVQFAFESMESDKYPASMGGAGSLSNTISRISLTFSTANGAEYRPLDVAFGGFQILARPLSLQVRQKAAECSTKLAVASLVSTPPTVELNAAMSATSSPVLVLLLFSFLACAIMYF